MLHLVLLDDSRPTGAQRGVIRQWNPTRAAGRDGSSASERHPPAVPGSARCSISGKVPSRCDHRAGSERTEGGASGSLHYKMAERLNCVQNSITIRNQVLIRNKVAGFIIVGGQDNIQGAREVPDHPLVNQAMRDAR